MMDGRKERIGEHKPEWATRALGPVPGELLNQLAWQRKTASIGTYRELSGFDHPAEAIGPEPVTGDPDRRVAWHEALACLGQANGTDVRSLPDHSSLEEILWVINGYALPLAAMLITAGWVTGAGHAPCSLPGWRCSRWPPSPAGCPPARAS